MLSRVEDAGLNASAPPQQRWVDGWLVRFCPGKAKRARCINAVAPGRLSVAEKLALCQRVFDDARLPLIFRITPLSQPSMLDSWLEKEGLRAFDDTRVMIQADLSAFEVESLGADVSMKRVSHSAFAQIVGQLRGSPLAQQQAHAQRLELSPVPFEGWVLRRAGESAVLACAQTAQEGELVGLYDVFTAGRERNRGWARKFCAELLQRAREKGATTAYLQVDADNHPARAVYHRLGFADGYAYHYRTSVPPAD
ncbi:MAG: GNAT family N-acetyltransferase [Burkholderiaceae bacterium]|nr:GNAT family N-acetyltransferase [Burkholderiaceae bacterium]